MENLVKTCRNVYDPFRPLHLLLKVSGLAIYSVDASFKVTLKGIDWALIIFHFLLAIAMNFYYWNTIFVLHIQVSEIVRYFFPILAYMNFIIFCCAKVWTYCKRQQLGDFFQLLHDIDSDLLKLGFEIDYQRQKRTIVKYLLISNILEVFGVVSVYFSQKLYAIRLDLIVFIFTFYGLYMNFLLVTQYMTMVCGIKDRFTAIKEVLR